MSITDVETIQKSVANKPLGDIEIHQEDDNRVLRILYYNGDVAETTPRDIADVIKRLHINRANEAKLRKNFETQLTRLIERLTAWCHANTQHISMAVWVPQDNYSVIHFLVVQNDNVYNEEFSRNLTRLEIEIEDSEPFSHFIVKVMELPHMDEGSIDQFVQNYASNI